MVELNVLLGFDFVVTEVIVVVGCHIFGWLVGYCAGLILGLTDQEVTPLIKPHIALWEEAG